MVVTLIALAGLLITLPGLWTGRDRPSVVVAKSNPREAERVTVRDWGMSSRDQDALRDSSTRAE